MQDDDAGDSPDPPEVDFAELMEQLRSGNEEAAWTLIEIYGPHIQRVVRRDLNRRLRSRFDSGDFVQAVWASFFRQPSQFRQMQGPDQLMTFLAAVARNKVIDETRRRFNTQKEDIAKEQLTSPEAWSVEQIPSNDPRPSQVAVAREQWKRLIEGQPREIRRILELRFAGFSYEEIAAEVNLHERSVRRIVDQLMQQLEEG